MAFDKVPQGGMVANQAMVRDSVRIRLMAAKSSACSTPGKEPEISAHKRRSIGILQEMPAPATGWNARGRKQLLPRHQSKN
jgi:hypothetical protein